MRSIKLDEEDFDYGSWKCPVCKAGFFGGGVALHEHGCGQSGYGNCDYTTTRSELDVFLKIGTNATGPLSKEGLLKLGDGDVIACCGELLGDRSRGRELLENWTCDPLYEQHLESKFGF